MIYLQLKDDEYTRLRKKLLKEKGSSLQKEFLCAAKDSQEFISWVEGEVGVDHSPEAKSFDLWSNTISESEYKEPPKQVEKHLYKIWSELTPAQACQETFWGHVTLEHIKQGVIESCFLAANGGNLPGGLERIDKALDEGKDQAIDSIVRTILRRMSGLPEARGSKSVYVNCPFSRAWWRGYVANQVCEDTNADHSKVIKTLTISQEYWERLIILIVSRNSVLGDTNVRSALIWALSELVEDDGKKRLFVAKTLGSISRAIGIRSAWQELGVFPVDELKALMEEQIFPSFSSQE